MGSMSEVEACYAVPNISARGYQCKTNLPPTTVMRGAGRPQAAFIAEHWIRTVADFLNIPAAKVRASEINQRKKQLVITCNRTGVVRQ